MITARCDAFVLIFEKASKKECTALTIRHGSQEEEADITKRAEKLGVGLRDQRLTTNAADEGMCFR